MLGQRQIRWTSLMPALDQRLVFAGLKADALQCKMEVKAYFIDGNLLPLDFNDNAAMKSQNPVSAHVANKQLLYYCFT